MVDLEKIWDLLKQSDSEVAAEQKKIKAAQSIISSLSQLKREADIVCANMQCELAVIKARQIIDGE